VLDPDADGRRGGGIRPAFAHLALLVQIAGVMSTPDRGEKGSPLTERERSSRGAVAAARAWLEAYAPDRARIAVRHEALPTEAAALEPDQQAFLTTLADGVIPAPPSDGDAWQTAIFAAAASTDLPAGRAFAALYLAFLGRTNGPRAGWLLASLDPAFVVGRLRDAAGAHATPAEGAG
jgi:lysyl-tRNA synthetase class 1